MIFSFAVVVALAISNEPYARSHIDENNVLSHCLFWEENSRIVYNYDTRGNDEIPNDGEYVAINKAFDSWRSKLAGCGSLTLVEGPRSTSRELGWKPRSNDNQNLILFRSKKCQGLAPANDHCWIDENCGNVYDCWQHRPDALAVTINNYDPDTGRILDTDIEFNQAYFLFTVVDSPVCPRDPNTKRLQCALDCVCTDIQNTATHEIGHFLGLNHTTFPGSIMGVEADPGELTKRDIDAYSTQFVCDTYPKGDVAQDCITVPFKPRLGKADGCGCSSAAGMGGLALAMASYAALRRWRRRA